MVRVGCANNYDDEAWREGLSTGSSKALSTVVLSALLCWYICWVRLVFTEAKQLAQGVWMPSTIAKPSSIAYGAAS